MHILFLGPAEMTEYVRSCLPQGARVLHAASKEAVEQAIGQCDVIFDAYMKIHFPADLLDRAAHLRLFITATTGADHVDASALARRSVPLFTLRDVPEALRDITAAAEHSWLLLMSCARRFRAAIEEPLRGEWDRNKFPGIMLRGKTLGLVGCGRIGGWMARYAGGFGMQAIGYDPHLQEWPADIEERMLDEVLRDADILSVHVPLNNETRGIIGEREFRLMKDGVIIVNSSRGEVMDEGALLRGLESGKIAAAGLDVLAGEPDIANHPLVEYARVHDNLVITPHIGGFSPDALRYVLALSCRRIVEYLNA